MASGYPNVTFSKWIMASGDLPSPVPSCGIRVSWLKTVIEPSIMPLRITTSFNWETILLTAPLRCMRIRKRLTKSPVLMHPDETST